LAGRVAGQRLAAERVGHPPGGRAVQAVHHHPGAPGGDPAGPGRPRPPPPPNRAAPPRGAAPSRSFTTTRAPSAANRRASAAPIPLPPPVITTPAPAPDLTLAPQRFQPSR